MDEMQVSPAVAIRELYGGVTSGQLASPGCRLGTCWNGACLLVEVQHTLPTQVGSRSQCPGR